MRLKKAFIIFLASVYLVMTSGVMVNIHYCMGEFASLNYGHQEDDVCGKCGMTDRSDCCHTEHKLLKADDDHLASKSVVDDGTPLTAIPVSHPNDFTIRLSRKKPGAPAYHSPPDQRENNLSIFTGVFRI